MTIYDKARPAPNDEYDHLRESAGVNPEGPDASLLPGASALVGVDANAFAVIAETSRLLRAAGATKAYVDLYRARAMAGDYDHLLRVSMDALDGAR